MRIVYWCIKMEGSPALLSAKKKKKKSPVFPFTEIWWKYHCNRFCLWSCFQISLYLMLIHMILFDQIVLFFLLLLIHFLFFHASNTIICHLLIHPTSNLQHLQCSLGQFQQEFQNISADCTAELAATRRCK